MQCQVFVGFCPWMNSSLFLPVLLQLSLWLWELKCPEQGGKLALCDASGSGYVYIASTHHSKPPIGRKAVKQLMLGLSKCTILCLTCFKIVPFLSSKIDTIKRTSDLKVKHLFHKIGMLEGGFTLGATVLHRA